MKELFNSFERHTDILQDHHGRRITVAKSFEDILDWKKHIRDRPQDFPVMDKIRAKKAKVTIKTWRSICDVVDSNITDGHATCKSRWSTAKVLLDFLEFPLLDPIDQAPSPSSN